MTARTTRAQCTRYDHHGQRCTVRTRNADGWCRTAGCGGFTTATVPERPAPRYRGPASTKTEVPVAELGIDPTECRITLKASTAYLDKHGGGRAEATAALARMLEDFTLDSQAFRFKSGMVMLWRSGFRLYLSRDRRAVVDYRTNHLERVWEQVKAGVPSRVSARGRIMRARDTPRPEDGPPITLAEFAHTFDPATAWHSARCRGCFVKLRLGDKAATDAELTAAIRAATADLATGEIHQRETGVFEVVSGGLLWLLTPDARVVLGVHRAKTGAERA